jgi:hypothetical protein
MKDGRRGGRPFFLAEYGMQQVHIPFGGGVRAFELDPLARRWTGVDGAVLPTIAEGDFPLIAENAGKRYELYSDGTYAEVEL